MKNKTELTRRGYKGSEAPATVQDTGYGAQVIIDASLGGPVPAVGSRVGRYRLLRELGAGGMGVVFEALDPELDRKVAIKLLRPPFDKAQLVREARALARLSHPNVVTIYDVGEADGRTFIAMELIDGITLREWLARRARSFREILDVLVAAGRGLAAAHAAQLVHRDFKPENVMVGNDGRVRVLDFGIVSAVVGRASSSPPAAATPAAVSGDGNEARLSSSFTGTPAYMAPEQLSEQAIDERADQFSFCVVLWEAMYGERPFQGAQLSERVHGIAAVKSAEAPGRGVPAWLHRLVVQGLSGNLGARHASMETLLAAIETGLTREAAAARLIGRRYEPIQASHIIDTKPIERVLDRLTGMVVTIQGVQADDSTAARVRLARVYRELASLRHPNLVGVLDFGIDEQRGPYFVLDLRDAVVDLRAALRDPEAPVLDYLVQMLRALSYLHRHRMQLGAFALDDVFVFEHQVKLLPLSAAMRAERLPLEAANDNAPNSAADLHALGRLALSMFELARGLDPKIKPVLERLLDTDPAQRFESADAVIDALGHALGRSLATETYQTRESRLRAAPLLGRDAEVECLSRAVQSVCNGAGGSWLIGGESGVGKSRLLDEARSLALAQGALVLRGQEESEGGSPYRLFRDALRWLALLTDLDELEAGVLLPIVPDLSRVLGRVVSPAPELDASAMHARTCDVVTSILRRQKQPVVLLLEDLQWSRSDSIELLKQVIPITSEIPLLVIATDRDDERPSLRNVLTSMRALDLQRLAPDAVEKLLVAMIGEAARRPEVVRLLWRETEGNAFFLVEVVRALAEESGGMARIGAGSLPEKVFAGGIRRAVERRLQRVPEDARQLLRIAAVIGRSIDLELLASLAPDVDLERWSAQCVESSVLERTGESIRFAHDKLREGLLAELPIDEQRRLSRLVAEGIESAPSGGERYAMLAHHFGKAGVAHKEARYAALSGEQAVRSFAIAEGMALLSRALELTEETAETAPARARLHRLLGEACYYEGRFDEALSHLKATLSRLGISMPTSRWQWGLLLLRQALLQVALYMGLVRFRVASDAAVQNANEASWAAARAAYIYSYDMDMLRALTLSLVSVNQARRGAQENSFGLGVLGYAAASVKMKAGSNYFRRARQSAGNTRDNQQALADVMHLQASYLISVGHLDDAERVALESVAVAERIGDRMSASVGLNIASICDFLRGRLTRMLSRSQNNEASGGGEHRVLRACSTGVALCELGEPDKAIELLQLRGQAGGQAQLRVARVTVLGVTALAHARSGALPAAWAAVQESMRMGIAGELVPASCSVVLTGPLIATLKRWSWARAENAAEVDTCKRTADFLVRQLRAYGRVCRPGNAMFHYFDGHVRALKGDARGSQRAFALAIEHAHVLGMRQYEGLAHLELGRANPADSAARTEHLGRAAELLADCGISDYERLSDVDPAVSFLRAAAS